MPGGAHWEDQRRRDQERYMSEMREREAAERRMEWERTGGDVRRM